MKILLTGRNGQLGQSLEARLRGMAEVVATARAQLDLENERAVRDLIRSVRPDLVINAAAFALVDLAEKDRRTALRVNGTAPGVLAREAKANGAAILHYSTDYVFDGSRAGGYREDDAAHPVNEYGRSKLAGEEAIRESEAGHAILRVSWLYGGRYGNFLSLMVRLLRERAEVSAVDDQIGCPTWRGAVADATSELVGLMMESGESPAAFLAGRGGTFHLTGPGATSWFGFAQAIAAELASRGERVARVLPIPTAQYPRPAARPACSILLSDRIRERFGITLPPWERQLSSCFESTRRMASAA